MCGEHPSSIALTMGAAGSSPHVRGAPVVPLTLRRFFGIIPACAGSTSMLRSDGFGRRDHPRMCGEHKGRKVRRGKNRGSSPHVRGARLTQRSGQSRPGIIPACAGSTLDPESSGYGDWDHPRMCGEHVCGVSTRSLAMGSSPHVRGAHFENSIIPRKRKDNWLFFIQFRFENFLAFRYLLALLHPFLGVPTKDPSFASLGRLINCNPSQSTGDQSAPYTLKAICCSFLAE